jgi:hypothetical protein
MTDSELKLELAKHVSSHPVCPYASQVEKCKDCGYKDRDCIYMDDGGTLRLAGPGELATRTEVPFDPLTNPAHVLEVIKRWLSDTMALPVGKDDNRAMLECAYNYAMRDYTP